MARTSRSNPDDGSRSVISRSERYQLLEKKRSIDATPPRIVTKVVEHKKLDTTINDDVTSPLSTASLATSSSRAIPRMLEWARMKELLEPTIEHDDEDDNYGGGEFNDVSAVAVAAVDVAMAAAASKSTIDDDNYHSKNDDGDEGSGSSGKFNDKNYEDGRGGGM